MEEEPKELEENARRDFLAKAAAAAGALAATGLVAGLLAKENEASAAAAAPAVARRLAVGQRVDLQRAPLRYQKLRDGHSIEITSTEVTNVLAREGLISKDLMGKQSLMRVEIRYSL